MTTQAIQRELQKTMSLATLRTLIGLVGVLVLLGIVYLAQSTQATLTGQRVQELRERLSRLNREIDQLEYDIAVLTTPAKIAERARAQGLRPATMTQTVYLTVKNYPVTPAQPPVVSQPSHAVQSNPSIVDLWNEFLVRLGLRSGVRPVEASP